MCNNLVSRKDLRAEKGIFQSKSSICDNWKITKPQYNKVKVSKNNLIIITYFVNKKKIQIFKNNNKF